MARRLVLRDVRPFPGHLLRKKNKGASWMGFLISFLDSLKFYSPLEIFRLNGPIRFCRSPLLLFNIFPALATAMYFLVFLSGFEVVYQNLPKGSVSSDSFTASIYANSMYCSSHVFLGLVMLTGILESWTLIRACREGRL